MQAVGKPLVHVDDHRILLARLVAGRIEERSLQALTALVLVLDDLGHAPRVIVREGVGAHDDARVLEVRPADHRRRRLLERLNDVSEYGGVLRLRRAGRRSCLEHQRLRGRRTGIEPRIARALGPDAELC